MASNVDRSRPGSQPTSPKHQSYATPEAKNEVLSESNDSSSSKQTPPKTRPRAFNAYSYGTQPRAYPEGLTSNDARPKAGSSLATLNTRNGITQLSQLSRMEEKLRSCNVNVYKEQRQSVKHFLRPIKLKVAREWYSK